MADPNKWLGLMKWSMKYSDGTAPSSFQPMKKEDQDFLEKVLKEGVMDETERIKQVLRILDGENPSIVFAKEGEEIQEEKVSEEELAEYKDALLDELLTRIDQIDNAMNLVKMNGLTILGKLIRDNQRPSTRALAAEVCSVIVQNNPFCQDAALRINLLELFCLLACDQDINCRVKALLAISCLVRNYPPAETRFLSESCNGLLIVQTYLSSEDVRLQRKSLFFLRYLMRNSMETAKKVLEENFFVPEVAKFIQIQDIDLCESSLEGLAEFFQFGPEFAIACRQEEYGLLEQIQTRLNKIEALEDPEEKEFAQEIKKMANHLKDLLLSNAYEPIARQIDSETDQKPKSFPLALTN